MNIREPIKVSIKRNGEILAHSVVKKQSLWGRIWGLIGQKPLKTGEGLILAPCAMVHTCWMKYSIDLVFSNGEGEVIGLQENLKPWRISQYFSEARSVLELPAGTLTQSSLTLGDHLTENVD